MNNTSEVDLISYLFPLFLEYLPEPSKAQDHLKKLSEVLNEDLRIRGYMNNVVDPAVTCKKAIQAVVSLDEENFRIISATLPRNHMKKGKEKKKGKPT